MSCVCLVYFVQLFWSDLCYDKRHTNELEKLFSLLQTSRPLLLRKSMYKDTDIELKGIYHDKLNIMLHKLREEYLQDFISLCSAVLWMSRRNDIYNSVVFEVLPMSQSIQQYRGERPLTINMFIKQLYVI